MNKQSTRNYDNSKRAKAADRSAMEILKALGSLWLELPVHQITLDMIAERSGVTVRTILRKFGSKEGLYEEALNHDVAGIKAIKDDARAGDVPHIVDVLMQEYETTGMAGIRTLSLEHDFPYAGKILQKGRAMHRAWCARVFAPFLPDENHPDFALRLGAFYAATDINGWKVLRHDLGYSLEDTRDIFILTLEGLIHQFETR